jgi:cyclic beta-1,2-glucan synthetase
VTFKPGRTAYRIVVENPDGVSRGVKRVELDGADYTGRDIPIEDSGRDRRVLVILG